MPTVITNVRLQQFSRELRNGELRGCHRAQKRGSAPDRKEDLLQGIRGVGQLEQVRLLMGGTTIGDAQPFADSNGFAMQSRCLSAAVCVKNLSKTRTACKGAASTAESTRLCN